MIISNFTNIVFIRKLGIASGVASSGSGVGGMVFAPIIFYLNQEVGLEYTMYVLGGVTAISVAAAFVYQNLKRLLAICYTIFNF